MSDLDIRSPKPSTFTTWFTNSPVFSISPAHPLTNAERQNPTCPTAPYTPMTVTVWNPPSTSALNSSTGLRLDLALSVNTSGGITVVADVFNTRSSVNNLTAESHWPLDPSKLFLWVQGGCGAPSDLRQLYEHQMISQYAIIHSVLVRITTKHVEAWCFNRNLN
jgi:hypothetical protein